MRAILNTVFMGVFLFGISSFGAAGSFTGLVTTLNSVGCAGTGAGSCYVMPASNPQGCLYGVVYLNTDPAGQGKYAAALLAYATGQVVRIDYTEASNGICSANLISAGGH